FDFFVSIRRRHTRFSRDWSSDVCSSDLVVGLPAAPAGLLGGAGLLRFGARLLLLTRLLLRGLLLLAVGGRPGLVGLGRGGRRRGSGERRVGDVGGCGQARGAGV